MLPIHETATITTKNNFLYYKKNIWLSILAFVDLANILPNNDHDTSQVIHNLGSLFACPKSNRSQKSIALKFPM